MPHPLLVYRVVVVLHNEDVKRRAAVPIGIADVLGALHRSDAAGRCVLTHRVTVNRRGRRAPFISVATAGLPRALLYDSPDVANTRSFGKPSPAVLTSP